MKAAEKSAIRRATLSRRNALSAEVRREDGQVALARVTGTAEYLVARFVMAYCGFGSEIETQPLLHKVLRDKQELVLPKINRTTNEIDLFLVKDIPTELVPGVWGIMEPNPNLCARFSPKDLDLIVAPGVAFDKFGGRVGYGRGYYDKLLRACHAACKRPFIVAAAFELQIVDAVPMEDHDVAIDAIATELAYYLCDRGERT
ncbi:5-formyltetrahydrofolate cyclo-ligase [Bradyrhizobium genosp. P]|uniref:5-formyltetrahydrofolate cyclo-ligase n=1 Tax=Bradyrhizobium genosp. P TaxID=83641 RepID=UPI003CF5BA69